ncbi:type II toxin-antitoxin system Phd/YefM family antitoxin [Aestuariivirga sp.]|uniref:type II toxin-antitoxin system Phd/YefM family antitoxin n=1 Tax=Aestuariivirga sp. TaxID=2650926 RepID=UPI0039E24EDF
MSNQISLSDISKSKAADLPQTHKSVASSEARAQFSTLMDLVQLQKEKVVITAHSKPIAAVVPMGELKVLDWLKENNKLEDIYRQMENRDD